MATTKINFYERYAVEHMEIDMDDKGLFCKVCSERHENVSYTVRVDESQLVPVATSCNCASIKPCKHMHMVTEFYARIYRSNVEKAQAKAAQVEVVETPVEQVPPIAMELTAELRGRGKKLVATDLSTKGSLNGAQQTAGLLMALPSRKAKAS